MTSGKVVLKIRTSDLSQEDQIVVCDPKWSVRMVKELAHGNSGSVDLKKLKYIYGGKYLLDDTVLNTVFKISSEPQVVHLLSMDQSPNPKSLHHVTSNPAFPHVDTSSAVPQATELRHRHTYPNLSALSQTTWTPEQMNAYYQHPAWQQYHHHMAQYMQYYNAAYASRHQSYPHHTPHVPVQPQMPERNAHGAPAPVNAGQVNVNPANNNNAPAPAAERDVNPPMNAQGGFAVADDDEQNDWLDVLFTMMRGGFFLSIIYFYSTMFRFIFVSLLFLCVYIYQAGYLRPARRRAPANDPPQPPQVPDNNNNHEDAAPATNEEVVEEPQIRQPEPPSVFATAWCFFTTFFTSLIPQGPPVGN